MNFLIFGTIFLDFSEAWDLFLIIFGFWTDLEKMWTVG
jgi:hypothetical protein